MRVRRSLKAAPYPRANRHPGARVLQLAHPPPAGGYGPAPLPCDRNVSGDTPYSRLKAFEKWYGSS